MSVVSMKQLLESGVHFGHQTRRWNPKMAEFIYTKRNGIHIIDLQKTTRLLDVAYKFVKEISAQKKELLFVGTKKQAKESIKEEAKRSNSPYINSRWLGGTLTNFGTIKKRIERIEQLERMKSDGVFSLITKKEATLFKSEMERLEKFLGGIKEMKNLPGAIFVIDPKKEHIAVCEARKLNIPIVAISDTNCDPSEIDYVIPGNDDAVRAVRLFCHAMSSAVIEGCAIVKDEFKDCDDKEDYNGNKENNVNITDESVKITLNNLPVVEEQSEKIKSDICNEEKKCCDSNSEIVSESVKMESNDVVASREPEALGHV